MAMGAVVGNISSVNSGEYLNIRPEVGEEWVVHNILYSGSVEIELTDGTLSVLYDSDAGYGGRMGFTLHCTNDRYYRVKNVSGVPIVIAFDGVQTK